MRLNCVRLKHTREELMHKVNRNIPDKQRTLKCSVRNYARFMNVHL